ncbi:unnamed protein product [Urochloa humidicola]
MAGGSSSKKRRARRRRSRKRNPVVAELPDDLLLEILARVPYRSIYRFRCVSKRWSALISHPDNRGRLPQTLVGFFYSGFTPGGVSFTGEFEFDYLVVNPAIEERVPVPVWQRGSVLVHMVGLGFDPAFSEFQMHAGGDDDHDGDGYAPVVTYTHPQLEVEAASRLSGALEPCRRLIRTTCLSMA